MEGLNLLALGSESPCLATNSSRFCCQDPTYAAPTCLYQCHGAYSFHIKLSKVDCLPLSSSSHPWPGTWRLGHLIQVQMCTAAPPTSVEAPRVYFTCATTEPDSSFPCSLFPALTPSRRNQQASLGHSHPPLLPMGLCTGFSPIIKAPSLGFSKPSWASQYQQLLHRLLPKGHLVNE